MEAFSCRTQGSESEGCLLLPRSGQEKHSAPFPLGPSRPRVTGYPDTGGISAEDTRGTSREPRSPLHFSNLSRKRHAFRVAADFGLPSCPTSAEPRSAAALCAPQRGCGTAGTAGRAPARPRSPACGCAPRAGLRGGSRRRREMRGAPQGEPRGSAVPPLRRAGAGPRGRRRRGFALRFRGKARPGGGHVSRRDRTGPAAAPPAGAAQSARHRRSSSSAPPAARARRRRRCPPGARRPTAPRHGPARVSCSNKQ